MNYIDENLSMTIDKGEFCYTSNHQFSTIGMIDTNGVLKERYSYTAFGEAKSQSELGKP